MSDHMSDQESREFYQERMLAAALRERGGDAPDLGAQILDAARCRVSVQGADELAAEGPAADEPVPGGAGSRRSGFFWAWCIAAGLAGLMTLPALANWAYRSSQWQALSCGKVHLLVAAPPAVLDGSELRFHVETHNLANQALEAQIDWQVLDAEGGILAESTAECRGSIDVSVGRVLDAPRTLVVTASVPELGFRQTVEQALHSSKAAPLVHLSSDKPAYRPGEPVMLRVVCLDRLTLRGADQTGLRCRIVGPKQTVLQDMVLSVGRGTATWAWQVPRAAAGGRYAMEVRDEQDKFTLERLEFLVRNFQPPKLRKKVTLARQSYAPGEHGAAAIEVTRAIGGPAAGAEVQASLVIDGTQVWQGHAILDGEGRARFRFAVPDEVSRGAARFVARVTDGGDVESELKSFVVSTGLVDVELYPEGGDLLAGAKNRVYAQVRDPLGRPLSAEGEIVDDAGRVVAPFRTLHMGRARFAFTPLPGRRYQLRLSKPSARSFDLPVVRRTGVVLQPLGDFVAAGAPVRCQVFAAGAGPWIAAVFCRGVLVGQQSILRAGSSELSVPVIDQASGVLRVTVFDRMLRPVAERLLQRDASRHVTVTLTPAAVRATPGSKQRLTIRTTDETGAPVSCVVGLTVSDRSVADMLEFVRTGLSDQRQLWADVAKPDQRIEEFLGSAMKHRRNVDLLLGSMGWRRYLWRGRVDEKVLAAAGGDWAQALPMREGRSGAPRVTDNFSDYAVEANAVVRGSNEAKEWASGFVGLSLIVFALLGMVHASSGLVRWLDWRAPVLVGSGITVVTVLLTGFALACNSDPARRGVDDEVLRPSAEKPAASSRLFESIASLMMSDADRQTLTAGFVDSGPDASAGSPASWNYVQGYEVHVAQGATFLDAREINRLLSLQPGGKPAPGYVNRHAVGYLLSAAGWSGLGPFVDRIADIAKRASGALQELRNADPQARARVAQLEQTVREYSILLQIVRRQYPGLIQTLPNATGVPGPESGSGELLSRDMDAPTQTRGAQLEQTIREYNNLLEIVNRRYPGIFSTMHPWATGVVSHLSGSGKLLTIQIGLGGVALKPGHTFAIFNATEGYKGEAVVVEIDGSKEFCFARLVLNSGPRLVIGDHASTDVSRVGLPVGLSAARWRQIDYTLRDPQLGLVEFRYAHKAGDSRRNFAETLCWKPFLLTDDRGEATIEFDVSDTITTWKVHADAHGSGRVGQGEASFESYLPFFVEPKVPTRVIEGDVLRLPISLVADDVTEQRAQVTLQAHGALQLENPGSHAVALRRGRGRVLAHLVATAPEGGIAFGSLSVRGQVGEAKDLADRKIVVVPRGYPRRVDHAGKVRGQVEIALHLPDALALRTKELRLRLYPSPLANLEQAAQGMLRQPHGCFEQVTSVNYPNVMALRLLGVSDGREAGVGFSAVAAKARGLLANGYRQLTAYEVSGGGFSLWGRAPADASLTAYGLLQFTDMASVFEIDAQMVQRTRIWLLGARGAIGDDVVRDAYITYALIYSGEPAGRLQAAFDRLQQRAEQTQNAYELAIIALALTEADRAGAAAARQRLCAMQEESGALLGSGSITGSGQRDLRIETTAFAVLAWIAGGGQEAQVRQAIDFLQRQREGAGTFGSTQATVMALKALTAYLGSDAVAVHPGTLRVFVDDKEVHAMRLYGTEKRTISVDNLSHALGLGDNRVRIELSDGNEFPFSLDLRYRADLPRSSPDCQLVLETRLGRSVLTEGETTALQVRLQNISETPVTNPMVILGLPASLQVNVRVLDDLKKAGAFAAWELRDGSIVLYLRGLDVGEVRDLAIDLIARVPGVTMGAASCAYPYYDSRQVKWVAPIRVEVAAGR